MPKRLFINVHNAVVDERNIFHQIRYLLLITQSPSCKPIYSTIDLAIGQVLFVFVCLFVVEPNPPPKRNGLWAISAVRVCMWSLMLCSKQDKSTSKGHFGERGHSKPKCSKLALQRTLWNEGFQRVGYWWSLHGLFIANLTVRPVVQQFQGTV